MSAAGEASWKEFVQKGDFSFWSVLGYAQKRSRKGIIHDIGFASKYLMHRSVYREYLKLLSQQCCHGACEHDRTMIYKLMRPYEVCTYSIEKRLEVLRDHYSILSEYFTPEQFDLLGAEFGIRVKDFPTTEAVPVQYSITLQYNGTHRREAELSLEITRSFDREGNGNATCERVFSAAVNFGNINGHRVLKINSIQGCTPHLPEPMKEISAATKAGYGIMPKYLMILLAFRIAELTGCEHVLGIKTESHIYANSHYSSKINKDFHYDYDAQWKEFKGEEYSENYLKLSKPERTPLEEIPSKKRSQHRKRYAFIDEIYDSLAEVFKRHNV
jgi:uncharacterized protein VirK/YbjX